jgi:hypothetical protein
MNNNISGMISRSRYAATDPTYRLDLFLHHLDSFIICFLHFNSSTIPHAQRKTRRSHQLVLGHREITTAKCHPI